MKAFIDSVYASVRIYARPYVCTGHNSVHFSPLVVVVRVDAGARARAYVCTHWKWHNSVHF